MGEDHTITMYLITGDHCVQRMLGRNSFIEHVDYKFVLGWVLNIDLFVVFLDRSCQNVSIRVVLRC